jgi:hypothetical protein
VLPFKEVKYKTVKEFENAAPHEITQIKQSRASKPCDEYAPYFQIISVQHVSITLNYVTVVETLLQLLVLVYNKLT